DQRPGHRQQPPHAHHPRGAGRRGPGHRGERVRQARLPAAGGARARPVHPAVGGSWAAAAPRGAPLRGGIAAPGLVARPPTRPPPPRLPPVGEDSGAAPFLSRASLLRIAGGGRAPNAQKVQMTPVAERRRRISPLGMNLFQLIRGLTSDYQAKTGLPPLNLSL